MSKDTKENLTGNKDIKQNIHWHLGMISGKQNGDIVGEVCITASEIISELTESIMLMTGKIQALEGDEPCEKDARIKELEAFVQDIRDNYDCDLDGHRYGTYCRACSAADLLPKEETKEKNE